MEKKQYSNSNPPYLDKAWRYNQFNTIAERFKSLGFVPPSELKGIK
jgi:hypothetical protein